MRAQCIQAVSQALGRQITQAQAAKIEDRIRKAQRYLWQTDRQTMSGLSKAQQFTKAAEQAAKDIQAESANNRLRIAQTILKHNEIQAHVDSVPAGEKQAALAEKLAVDYRRGSNVVSVASSTDVIRHQALAGLAEHSEPFLPKWMGFDEGNSRVALVFKELHGEDSGNVQAKAYAKALTDSFESLRKRFNAAGGKIGKLTDWAHPQAHSAYLVFKMGKDNWINFIQSKLKRDRYVNEDGTGFTDQQFNDFLGHAWESIAYDGQLKGEVGASQGTGSKANAHSQSRELHFADADSYLEYHQALGEKSLHATLISHIDQMSKDIALIETMGPNAQHQFDWWNDYALKEDARTGLSPEKVTKRRIYNERLFKEVAGVQETGGAFAFGRFMGVMRSLNLIALGSSSISTITDLNTMNLTAQYNHLSRSKMLVEHLRALTDAESRRAARRLGIGLDAYSGVILRHAQEQLANGYASKVGGATVRLSGMPFITEANRQAFSITMMDAVHHVVDTHADLASINKTDARMLFTHGIDEADFAIWKQAVPETWTDGVSKLLTANAILKVPGIDAVALRKSADKFMAMVLDEQNMAVSVPGARERTTMNMGTIKNTYLGEISRAFWQFKSFGLSYFNNNLQRALSMESKSSGAAYAAMFAAQGLLLGAVAVQLKELVNGRDPLAMDNMKFAGKALLQSGGLGLFGDFLSSNNSQYGSSVLGAMAGPTISKAEQLYQLTWGNSIKGVQGEKTHVGAEALRLSNSLNPLGTLWFTKSAFNHLVLQNLQESLSPGYLRRMTQRAQREFGQSYYWKPGETVPDRSPDLSKALKKSNNGGGNSFLFAN